MGVISNASVTKVQSVQPLQPLQNTPDQSDSNQTSNLNNANNSNGINTDSSNEQTKDSTNSDGKKNSQNLSQQELKKAMETAQKLIEPHQTEVELKMFDKLDTYYLQIIDKDTKQVIGEVPAKQLLEIHAQVLEKLGLLVDKKV
jgi:flagellar protein FlaG